MESEKYEELESEAVRASENAHCPYSNFHVGAAVYCDDGSIVTGCNVENASYGLTICAERVAVFSAVSQGKRPVEIAVACPDLPEDSDIVYRMPCGACRQVMSEILPSGGNVFIVGTRKVFRVHDLLPEAFRL